MSHLSNHEIHAYAGRALDVRVDVSTSADATDFSAIGYRAQNEDGTDVISLTGLSASNGGNGILIDFTLSETDLDLLTGWYRGEVYATRDGAVRTLSQGWLHIGSTPAEEDSS